MRVFTAVLALFLCATIAGAQTSHDHSVGHDNNAGFRQQDVDIRKWLKRLENPERDVIKHRDGVIAALKLSPAPTDKTMTKTDSRMNCSSNHGCRRLVDRKSTWAPGSNYQAKSPLLKRRATRRLTNVAPSTFAISVNV